MSHTASRKGKNRAWIVILMLAGVIGVVSIGGILLSAPGRRELRELTIDAVDLKNLRDGIYVGEYNGTKDHFRDTQVKVTVSQGKISDILILKGALDKAGNPMALKGGLSIDDMFNNVIKSNTLQVDVISGATLTSKAHLKALEKALKQAQAD